MIKGYPLYPLRLFSFLFRVIIVVVFRFHHLSHLFLAKEEKERKKERIHKRKQGNKVHEVKKIHCQVKPK